MRETNAHLDLPNQGIAEQRKSWIGMGEMGCNLHPPWHLRHSVCRARKRKGSMNRKIPATGTCFKHPSEPCRFLFLYFYLNLTPSGPGLPVPSRRRPVEDAKYGDRADRQNHGACLGGSSRAQAEAARCFQTGEAPLLLFNVALPLRHNLPIPFVRRAVTTTTTTLDGPVTDTTLQSGRAIGNTSHSQWSLAISNLQNVGVNSFGQMTSGTSCYWRLRHCQPQTCD